ncbi:hypothetical protein BC939DRAFT_500621 [Gamsiella multidivaricata]|uniref:uncharacterized protein n=1 Tax=Gamsiella multidivaricata TaxID=101098 RepID=UPI00221FD2B1|nr:uncharacterized protein BC939DRAFT_500621 [Gamsiella multidivaricata]KAG0355985.1 hypothetical protein BGZ54_000889 [Gamsiella multidivaricata]KAI7828840.1 hypothetical protein BC939DRAFT_500621 [Gamsiella multidivaricata]
MTKNSPVIVAIVSLFFQSIVPVGLVPVPASASKAVAMGVDMIALDEGAKTPPRSARNKGVLVEPNTPMGTRRSDRIRKQVLKNVGKDDIGETITTPRGSSIHSILPSHFEFLNSPSPRRVELDQFKRRLQFKSGVRSNLMLTDVYKSFERKEKMKEFHEYQRGKRQTAQLKSRGLSLPAISKTRQTSVLTPSKEGEAPQVQFVARHNLRPRPLRVSVSDDVDALLSTPVRKGTIEKRKSQYKRTKSHGSFDFTSWKDRDEAWRSKRLANYMSSSKLAREATLFKKRKLEVCGWGNPQRNLGNYLSICWDYNPDLDAEKDQSLPDQVPCILNRQNAEGVCVESGVIYYPQTIDIPDKVYLTGYCFTVQSELALKYEQAQKVLFDQASELVHQSFLQYNMDLSLDSSLDDEFTIDFFVSSAPSTDMGQIRVRGVTQFIFMKAYIYVDKICVAQEYQKMGIGAFLIDRLHKIAKKRNKDILLYALGPVVGVYKKWGFEYCKEWPPIEGDIGAIMRKRIRTEGVVDSYVGLEWDGTRFS